MTHVEYSFDGRAFDFTSVGRSGSERFWADAFPARWTRVGRFFKAVVRDLNGERDDRKRLPGGTGTPRALDEYRTRHVRILPDDASPPDKADAPASAQSEQPVEQPESDAEL
jgi:hypothetical protein